MKKILLFLIGLLYGPLIFSCTTFFINKNGQLVFGRNYDWVTGGGIVNTNQRGLIKTSMKTNDGASTTWISKYGSITFNQYGKEFPTGGMNERSLVVELMMLEGTVYPAADSRPAVGALQWIQYQLDNAATTEEVIGSDPLLRIKNNATPIHFLVADAKGGVATIEFLDGKMAVHKGSELPFPVLTNNTYASSVQTANSLIGKNVSLQNNSLDRFVKACSMVQRVNEKDIDMSLTDYAFSILGKVAQGNFTKWSIVYDISNNKIHFKTNSDKDIKVVEFSVFDFDCSKPPRMFDMNQPGKGGVSDRFILPDKAVKRRVMDQVVEESRSRISISKAEEERQLGYEETVSCKH